MKGPEARFSQEFGKALKKFWPDVVGYRIESSTTWPGAPDWILLIKPGRVVFIELKVDHVITPAQAVVHSIMRKLNIEIYVLTKTISGAKVDSMEPKPLSYVISTLVENRIDVRLEPDQ